MEHLEWQPSSGLVECYEARTATIWPEYVRGVVIAQESQSRAAGYTAYVEYFKHGISRQLWGGRIFGESDEAKAWCEGEMARILRP
ncbi:MAG TPA: hypothetical protein VF897_00895 [Roseiflexaceae bacterium]